MMRYRQRLLCATGSCGAHRNMPSGRYGSRAAVASTQMAQLVYPQLRKCPERSGIYASCQGRTSELAI
jgi:hypothetical protein